MANIVSSLIVRLVDELTGPLGKATQAVQGFNAAATGGNFAESMARTQSRVGAAIAANEQALMGARAGLADAVAGWYILDRTIGSTVRTAADFQMAMNQVAAVSKATAEDMERLTEQAKQLGRTTQYTATDVASAMNFLAMAGLDADKILGAMPATLSLASSAQLDLGASADIVTNVMAGYRMEVSELNRVSDVLADSFSSDNTNLSQLGEAFKYAGPVLRAANVNFEEAAAALSMLGGAGMQGSMGGTSLRGAITRLLAPTRAAREAMNEFGLSAEDIADEFDEGDSIEDIGALVEQLGLQVTDASGKMLPLVDIVRQLEEHSENAGLMMRLFGQRAGPAMLALAGMGADRLAAFTDQLDNAGGRAQEMADVQMAGFEGQMRAWRSAVEGLQIAVGDTLLPVLTDLMRMMTDMVGPITAWVEEHPKLTAAIAGTAGALVGLRVAAAAANFLGLIGQRGALSVLKLGLDAVAAAGTPVAGFFETLRLRSNLAKASLGAQPAILERLGDAFVVLGRQAGMAAITMGPWFLGIIGIAAAVKLIWDNWSNLVAFFEGVGSAFLDNLDPAALDALSAALSPLSGIFEAIKGPLEAVWNFITGNWGLGESTSQWRGWGEALGAVASGGINALIEAIRSLLGFLGDAWDAVVGLGQAISDFFASFGGGPPAPQGPAPVNDAPAAVQISRPAIDAGPSLRPGGFDNGLGGGGVFNPGFARASGGPVWPGTSFLVGENEPELFSPRTPGEITPVSKLGGGVVLHQTLNITGINGDPREIARLVSQETEATIERILRGAHSDMGARA